MFGISVSASNLEVVALLKIYYVIFVAFMGNIGSNFFLELNSYKGPVTAGLPRGQIG